MDQASSRSGLDHALHWLTMRMIPMVFREKTITLGLPMPPNSQILRRGCWNMLTRPAGMPMRDRVRL